MLKMLADEVPFVPMYYNPVGVALRKGVEGISEKNHTPNLALATSWNVETWDIRSRLCCRTCHEQASIIVERVSLEGGVWILPDGDDAGVRCAESVLARVAPHRFTRWVKLTDGSQPTDCTAEQLAEMLYRRKVVGSESR